jgi:transposase InsO family protein
MFSLVVNAADQHTVNLLHLTDDALSLQDAGYRFTFKFVSTSEVPFAPDLPQHWIEFHSKMRELELKAAPVPSRSVITSEFLSSFSPAAAAQVALHNWMYSFSKGYVSADLSRRFARAHPTYLFNVKMKHVPLIVDSGASVCITPEKSDFKHGSYRSSNMKVRDLSGENKVLGEGLVHWPVKDKDGNTHVIEIFALHIPHAGVRLLSPQVLKRTHNIGGSIEDDGIHLMSPNVSIFAPYSSISNLPELELVDMPKTSSVWSDTFYTIHSAPTGIQQAHLSVIDPGNTNLSPSQKELLLWHQRLSHTNLSKVRLMCKNRPWVRVAAELAEGLVTDAILPCKHDATSRCNTKNIKCASCCMGKQTLRSHTTPRPTVPNQEMLLKTDDTTPGACISCDHYVSPLRGRLVTGYGTTTSTDGYTGGAIYVDHASGKIFHYPQVSLDSESTIRGKQMLESEAASVNVKVKKHHSDNGIFAKSAFKDHCKSQGQSTSFSGVGAHHQNGVAERSIRTISGMARSNLLHLMLHWPARCKLDLWALSMHYAVWIYNRIPRESLGGLSPTEFWSGTRSDHADLKRAHVFGCARCTFSMPICKMANPFLNGTVVPVRACSLAILRITRRWFQ